MAVNAYESEGPRVAVGARRDSPLGPVPGSYLRSLAAAGARPLVLEPSLAALRSAGELLAPCHGLLLTGGGDVAAELYGGEPGMGRDVADPLRDRCELALLAAAERRGLPVLAICHGMQLLNVARGGTLVQRLDADVAPRHGTPAAWTRHAVRLAAGSRLATALGAGELAACSSHHRQAVARLGERLAATGWSEDGVVEAIEDADGGWVVGVQWHPEDTAGDDAEQQRVFDVFAAAAEACSRAAAGRAGAASAREAGRA